YESKRILKFVPYRTGSIMPSTGSIYRAFVIEPVRFADLQHRT
ncbi:16448_t:CDS:1, partial [Funneliformis mosseae]